MSEIITAPNHISARIHRLESISTCKRGQVACVLTGVFDDIVSGMCNYNPATKNHSCERPEEQGNCGCLHAEVCAASQSRYVPAVKAWVSRAPCGHCAKVLALIGIREVYYFMDSWPMLDGFEVFYRNKITYAIAQHGG